jgi:cyclohexanecarboxylate-CoA ligase
VKRSIQIGGANTADPAELREQVRRRWAGDGLVAVAPDTVALWRAKGWWRERTFWDDFVYQVSEHPDKVAVVDRSVGVTTGGTLGYRQLRQLADRCAAYLLGLGVQHGEVVSVQLPNWWEYAVLALGCAKIGAVLNPIAPIFRERDMRFILERTRSRVCVVPDSFRGFKHAEMVAQLRGDLNGLEYLFAVRAQSSLPNGVESFENQFLATHWEEAIDPKLVADRHPDADDVALLMFTSGTTGEPKGVIHSYNTVSIGSRGIFEGARLSADDVVLMASTLGHLTGYVAGFVIPLTCGMKAVYQDIWNADVMLRYIDDEGVTWTMGATPFVLDALSAQRSAQRALTTFRLFITAGSAIPPHVIDETRHLLGAELIALWGMTEVSTGTLTRPGDSKEVVSSSDGQPVPWLDIQVIDDQGAEMPVGSEGRLLVRGAAMTLGYFRRPDVFKAALTADGWFDTGDLAFRRQDGGIRITGRTKDIIIRGGENVPVIEIEASLYRHPKIREIAVVGYPDPRLGERACAVVISESQQTITLQELRDHLALDGIAKQFWPERLEIVTELPKTASGKIQKAILREHVRE